MDHIEFSDGFLPLDETLRRAASANVGVIPSLPTALNRFALSEKLLEYVAKVPLVVARLETLEARFSSDEVTFFEPADAGSLADAFRYVAEHREESRTRAERAFARAKNYSWPGAPGALCRTGPHARLDHIE